MSSTPRRDLDWARAARAAIGPFLGTRLTVLVVGYLAAISIGYSSELALFRLHQNELLNLEARWDAQWYYDIARNGYRWNGNFDQQQNIVFFPAYPLLMRSVGFLIGGHLVAAGMLIAFVAFFWALTYVYRLARDEFDDEQAVTAIWLIASYPFAVYFSAVYTESLFLLAAVGAFFHFRRGEIPAGAAWGLLAGLTRPNGFVLSVALLLMVLQRAWRDRASSRNGMWRATVGASLAAATLPLVGAALYSAFVYSITGDPLTWAKAQSAWHREYMGVLPGVTSLVADRTSVINTFGLYAYISLLPIDAMHTAAAVFALALVVPVTRRLGVPSGLFVMLTLVPPLLMGGTMSVGRMTAILFPLFIWLGTVVPVKWRDSAVIAFSMGQGLIAALFFTWRALY